jgi:uncharacterized Zn finger protein
MRGWGYYPRPESVAEKKAKAEKRLIALRKKNPKVQPICIQGRKIATTFWGKGWCDHLDSFADYSNRLPRGRSYALHGAVCHLEINPGRIDALVSGSSMYEVAISVAPLPPERWKKIKQCCHGRIGSLLELLQGKFSKEVMAVVCDPKTGLFPLEKELKYECSCPDWADMCKHVAAVCYGIGHRLDTEPDLLFLLRDVDPAELLAAGAETLTRTAVSEDSLAEADLSGIFGVELADNIRTDMRTDTATGRSTNKRPAVPATEKKLNRPAPGRQKPAQAQAKTNAKVDKQEKTAPREEPPAKEALTGKDIVDMRKKAGLTQAEFAKELKVSVATVSIWENRDTLNLYHTSKRALMLWRKRHGC